MKIWVDGDSVPRDIRQLLIRRDSSSGTNVAFPIEVRFVSARKLSEIPAAMAILVEPGADAADRYIENAAVSGDLVVTRDIPFAQRIAEKGIAAINDKGDSFAEDTAAERRSLRDAAEELRFLGLASPLSRISQRTARDTKRFADMLDRTITALKKGKSS